MAEMQEDKDFHREVRTIGDFYRCYSLEDLIHKGKSSVFLGKRLADNTPVAVKVIPKNMVAEWELYDTETVPIEVFLLLKLRNIPGVVSLLDYFPHESEYFIIMKKPAVSMNLLDYYSRYKPVPIDIVKKHFQQLVKILLQCQEARIFHRNIIFRHIVVDLESHDITLIDFGSGCCTDAEEHYIAPFLLNDIINLLPFECYILGSYNGQPATVWSLGLLLSRMISGVDFNNFRSPDFNGTLTFPVGTTLTCMDLILQCLFTEPSHRPTLKFILQHAWLN